MNIYFGQQASKTIIFSAVILFLSLFPVFSGFGASEEGENKTDFIMHHVQDTHEWHFATIGHTHISIPLPVILFEPDQGFHFYMSSDFVDENHHYISCSRF